MSAFRSFLIYDYNRNFFFLFIRKGFQVTSKWNSCRRELENKLVEMIKAPLEIYEQISDYGRFQCKYDKKNKCYFILLCSQEVKEEKQLAVLTEIYDNILKNPNYQKIKKDELEQKKSREINKLLEDREAEYITENGMLQHFQEPEQPEKQAQVQVELKMVSARPHSQQNLSNLNSIYGNQQLISNIQIGFNRSQLQQHSGFASQRDLNPDILLKIFRCFLMWDYDRQFFFMFIRRGFPIDKTWSQERIKLEAELKAKKLDPNDPKAKPKEPPEMFDYTGEFGLYKAKYDKKAKCYFILLSRFKTKDEPQLKLLTDLYDSVLKVEKYTTFKYDVLETKLKHTLEKQIDDHETELTKLVSQRFIDPKLFEQKFGRIVSPDERTNKAGSRCASPKILVQSNNNLSSKKSSLFMSSGKLIQQYQINDDVLIQEQQDIPEFTEQGEIAARLNKYQSNPLEVEKYLKQQN